MDAEDQRVEKDGLKNTGPITAVLIVVCLLIWGFSPGSSRSGANNPSATLITTAYTNTTANVRSCGSSSCSIVGTYPPGTSVDVSTENVSDIAQLPDWVTFSYENSDGTTAAGYMNKTVLSSVKYTTPSPTPTTASSKSTIAGSSGNLSPAFIKEIEPSVVEINCYSADNTIESSGSGVSYIPENSQTHVVMTNYHVYAGAVVNGVAPTCYAVFPEPPNFYYNGNYGDYRLTLTAWHYNPSTYEDAAIFTLGSSISSQTPSPVPNIKMAYDYSLRSSWQCPDSEASTGASVTIFGYPNSGNLLGVSETVTEGIISGILPGPIYKTNAGIDHGNSGGIAILNKSGCSLGIPTLGQSGLTSGIGYIQSYSLVKAPINNSN